MKSIPSILVLTILSLSSLVQGNLRGHLELNRSMQNNIVRRVQEKKDMYKQDALKAIIPDKEILSFPNIFSMINLSPDTLLASNSKIIQINKGN